MSADERRRSRRERYRRLGHYRELPAGDGAAIAAGRQEAPLNGSTPTPPAS
jgi:hypothetical protein